MTNILSAKEVKIRLHLHILSVLGVLLVERLSSCRFTPCICIH